MSAENLNHFTKEYKHIIQRGVIMNTKFFIKGRCYKTPCKTVLNAETFTVMFNTCKHIIAANVSDKCYFTSIDNIGLSDIKCDFHFSRNYTKPKEFLSKLYETFVSFLNTSIYGKKFPLCKNSDEVLDRILEIITATDTGSAEQSETAEKNVIEIVDENEYAKLEKELIEPVDTHIDDIQKFKEKSTINSLYGISSANETKELIEVEHFEHLTGTLYKSLFKAIGLTETRKIPFIISNNMVFFNYNGIQYKYYPTQCKIFKKCARKYQLINWKDFAEENNPDGQKQNRGRSPPLLLI